MNKKVYFKTFGCRTNLYDSQVMMGALKEYELTVNESEADMIVINSCTVTNGADSGIRNYINSIKKKYPSIKIFFTGCGVSTQAKKLFELKKIDGVFGHSEKEKINEFLQKDSFFEIGDLTHIDNTIITNFVGKSRAFVKIQEGCDFDCSYCIIPSVRGKARSLKEETILEQIKALSYNGFSEFILTGTNLGSYGKDTNTSLAKLIKKISQIKNVKRIRLGSLEPNQIDDEFFELLNEEFMAKHLHIAIQHVNSKILKLMKRKNRFDSDLALFEKIANFGYALGTDFIVGFPQEDDSIWQDSIKKIDQLPLTHIHSFIYSKRDLTLATNFKNQTRGDVAKQRLRELNALIKQKNLNFKKTKQHLVVLIEKSVPHKNGFLNTGYDQFFNKCEFFTSFEPESNWFFVKKALN